MKSYVIQLLQFIQQNQTLNPKPLLSHKNDFSKLR